MFKYKKISLNMTIVFFIITFMIISILTINSSMLYLPKYSGNLAIKQSLWYIFGFIIIIFILLIPANNYKYHYYYYFFNILILLVLLILATPINGSKCWFVLPGIGSIQPSEFMKISLIITLSKVVADWASSIGRKPNIKQEFNLFFKVIMIVSLPIVLTFLEPDTGAVLIYLVITLSIIFISPVRKRWFIVLFIIFLLLGGSFTYLYFFNQDLFIKIFGTDLFYRIDRLLDWKNGTGMQLENSLTAIGSSGFIGHGYKHTPIYFPESGTDFIFAVFASNFGLVGCIILIVLLLMFDLYLIKIAKRMHAITSKYIVIGTIGMLVYQQFQNIGMTLGILPITGITLPFISYGGSSLLSYLLIIGIILKIYSDDNKSIN